MNGRSPFFRPSGFQPQLETLVLAIAHRDQKAYNSRHIENRYSRNGTANRLPVLEYVPKKLIEIGLEVNLHSGRKSLNNYANVSDK